MDPTAAGRQPHSPVAGATATTQTPIPEKMENDSSVKVIENEGVVSTKPKEASKDGMKNYFVSNFCWLDALADKEISSACLLMEPFSIIRSSCFVFSHQSVRVSLSP
jgi:hypothetical protein